MGMRSLMKKLATDNGIELDDAELDMFSDDDDGEGDTEVQVDDVLSQELPGEAAGSIEIFLAAESTTLKEPAKEDGDLLWYPIIREGQWAVRPGQTGAKKRTPLKVIAGSSKNQRREIGLQDIVSAFDENAVQHVTVPISHSNTLLENTGFIDKLKIVQGKVKDQTKKGKPEKEVAVLMGGYRFTEPDIKSKVMRGTIANRSAGLLYDYVDTERGKTWPVVLEHCALTNKPWITGMVNFGRKLAGIDKGKLEVVGLSLSDDAIDDVEYAESLSFELELSDADLDFLAQESKDWSKEGSPSWLRQQVDSLLRDARRAKQMAATPAGAINVDYDYPPRYRCVEAKPGAALISDDYGDDANFWTAPISVKDGAVELAEYAKWQALKKAFMPDQRPDPPPAKLPLADDKPEVNLTRLELAQRARKKRGAGISNIEDPNPREVVKQDMSDTSTSTKLSDLSPEAQAMIQAAEARAAAAEAKSDKFAEQIDRLNGHVNKGVADEKIAWLSSDDGLGLSEARGFSGFLAEMRQVYLADDGEIAVQADHFAADGNSTGELTISAAFDRVFGALEKSITSKKALGELLSQPADAEVAKDKDGNPITSEAGTDASQVETPGKPGADDAKLDQLSTEQKVDKIAELSPSIAGMIGRRPEAANTTQNGGK